MGYLSEVSGSFYRITGNQLEARQKVGSLSGEQLHVLKRLIAGQSLSSVAAELGRHVRQIEAVRSEILRKFDAHTTADLIRIGIYAGMWDEAASADNTLKATLPLA